MMKLQRTYLLLVVLILAFTGCDKLIYDQPETGDGVEPKVYLSVNIRTAEAGKGLRSSINTDTPLAEDSVRSLAMLIFKSDNGARVGMHVVGNSLGKGDSTRAFTVEMNPGKYDLYFVANMPDMQTALNATNIPDRDAMDIYLGNTSRELTAALYRGASQTEGFPMARVYLKQDITQGGTIYQPKPFHPKQYPTEETKVMVNALGSGTVEKPYVELIRVVAKLEVRLDGAGLGVDTIFFRNANRHFRLVESETVVPASYVSFTTSTGLRKLQGSNTYIYYMPEAIIGTTSWNSTGSNQVINYFTIVTLDGRDFDIPIITYEGTIPPDYLSFAKGSGATDLYSIYRNRHYIYTVKNLQQIEINYQIDPWNKVTRSTYLGYGYNVLIDENNKVTISNTVDACPPHEVKLVGVGGTLIDGVSEQTFTNHTPGAKSPEYQLGNLPSSGSYLEVWYNDILVKTFTK